MALSTPTGLDSGSGSDGDSGTAQDTGSIDPTAGSLTVLVVAQATGGGNNPDDALAISGARGTWEEVDNTLYAARRRLSLWVGYGSVTEEAVSIQNTTDSAITETAWSLFEITGQDATTPFDAGVAAQAITATPVAPDAGSPDTGDMIVAGVAVENFPATTLSAGSNYTEIHHLTGLSAIRILMSMYDADAGDETADASLTSTDDWGIVACIINVGSGAQNLTPSLFSNSQTFQTPVVVAGAVSLTPSLFTNDQTFQTPVVNSLVDLQPSLFADGDTFYIPVVSEGVVDLQPSLFSDDDTFYTQVIGGAVDLQPSLFADDDTFFVQIVGKGVVDLQPSLFSDGDTFYIPVVGGGSVDLQPDLYEDGDTFYVLVVSKGAVDLQPSLFADEDTFYTQVVGATINLSPSLYSDADTFYVPTVDLTLYEIEAELFVNNQTYYTQDVSGGEPSSFGQDQGRLKVNIRRWRI